MRLTSRNAAVLFPLVLLLGVNATHTSASWFYDPATQTRRHVGSAVNSTPKDLVVIRRGPDYPTRSRMFKEEGTVWLNIWLTEHGTVGSTAIEHSSGFPRLDDAAVRFMRDNWHYTRANKDEPMPTLVQAEVTFRLD
jgi:TonB family protein